MKLPKVGIYLNPRQLKKQLRKVEFWTGLTKSNQEKIVEIRIEGRINYHDAIKIQKMKKFEHKL
jgi:hypothetical protein